MALPMSPGAQEYAKNGVEYDLSSYSDSYPSKYDGTKIKVDSRKFTSSTQSVSSSNSGESKIRSASHMLANKLKNKILPKGSSDDKITTAAAETKVVSEEEGSKNPKYKKESKTVKKSTISKKVLPPRIPTRHLVPVDPPEEGVLKRVATNDYDDGSVECSVLKKDDVTQAVVEEEREDDDDEEEHNEDPDGVTTAMNYDTRDDDSAEDSSSLNDNTTLGDDRDELRSPTNLLTTVAVAKKDKKKSRIALVKKKLRVGGGSKKKNSEGSNEVAPNKAVAASAGTTSVKNTKKTAVTSTTSNCKAPPSLTESDECKRLSENKKEEEMTRLELFELLKKEREAAAAAAARSESKGDGSSYCLDSKIGRECHESVHELICDIMSVLFSGCDITQDRAGVDLISKNLDTTKDELLRKVHAKKRTTTRSATSRSIEDVPKNTGGTEEGETPIATANVKDDTDTLEAEITEFFHQTSSSSSLDQTHSY